MSKILIVALLTGAALSIAAQSPQTNADVQHKRAQQGRQAAGSTAGPRSKPGAHPISDKGRRAPSAQASGPLVNQRPHVEGERRTNVQPGAKPNQAAPIARKARGSRQRAAEGARPGQRIGNRQAGRDVAPIRNTDRRRPPAVSHVPRIGTQPPLRAERSSRYRPQWNTNWRNNQRYDWIQWRRQHRSLFHMRPYRDPYGWAYQLFTIGWRLWPNFYSSSYWIDDPWSYRLPPAPEGTRWIRYYNDALLVDVWSGEVIDVVHDVFW